MKKLSLIMAAAALALSANAGIYLIGGFNNWAQQDGKAEFTKQEDGSYVLDFAGTLTSDFKINDGSWEGDVNLGGSGSVVLGQAYELVNMGGNIQLADGAVDNPHIVLNKELTTMTITGAAGELVTTYDLWGNWGGGPAWSSVALTEKNGKWVNEHVSVGDGASDVQFGIRQLGNGSQTAWYAGDAAYTVTEQGGTYNCTNEKAENFTVLLPGTYSMTFDPAAMTLVVTGEGGDVPTPPVPPTPPTPGTEKDLYLVGAAVGGWTLLPDYKMTQNGNVYTITLPNGLTGEWKIWDGTWDYNFGTGGALAEGTESEIWFDGGNCTTSLEGEVTVTFTLVAGSDEKNSSIASKILVSGGQVVNPPVPPTPGTEKDLYLVGAAVGGWTLLPDYKMTQNGNVYTITVPNGLNGEWKIWDGTWDYSFGTGGQLAADVESDIWFNGANCATSLEGEVTVTFTLVDGSAVADSSIASKILVSGGQVVVPDDPTDKEVYLVGEMNGWTPGDAAYKMTKNGNVYTISLTDGLNGEFKLCDGTWDWSFGAPEKEYPVSDNVDCDAWYNSSNNFKAELAGNVTVTFTLVEGSAVAGSSVPAVLNVKKESTDGVEAVEVAEGVAEYYNLQGVKVAAPVKGIYVKVVNGKASKVVL